ncbi:MAG: winged helix-turn-helix domain-containing protein [Candidatus Omnitrophica bacterium]|nr:winged helix-turn-helix domain-containing protein [Candidatus Omnitrophota bacterium]
MIMQIGIIAGDIWHHLDENNGTAKIADMINALGESREDVLMSLGWLAREGHILIEKKEGYKITLRK